MSYKYSTVQKECKRISPNFATFRYFSTKYNEISFEIRRIFETPIVSVKTKIRKAARIFERNIAETQRNFERNFEIAHRKFAAKIRLLNERSKTLFVDFHLLILPRLCLHAYGLVMTQMLVYPWQPMLCLLLQENTA